MEQFEVCWVDENNQEQKKVFNTRSGYEKSYNFYLDKLREGASQATFKNVVASMLNAKELTAEDCLEKLKLGHTLFVNDSAKVKEIKTILEPFLTNRDFHYAITSYGNFSDESQAYWVIFLE